MLGTGTLFLNTVSEGGTTYHNIGLSPDDGRTKDWMNPRSLYRCHEQTVRLIFVPEATGRKRSKEAS